MATLTTAREHAPSLPRHPVERHLPAALLVTALCGFLFFYGLTAGELYRTESLRAIIASEFLRTGDWIVPRLYGEPLFTKPPGMYAAIALASLPFGGVNEWTARLPSALAATATVFLFYWYFRRQLGRLGGLTAAAILPLSIMWLDKAPSAEIDMLQVAWVAGAIVFFLRALEYAEETESLGARIIVSYRVSSAGEILSQASSRWQPPDRRGHAEWVWWLASVLCVAGGFLTKWTAPAFFYGTVIPLLWWRGRLRLLLGRHHLICATVAASVCLAWVVAAVAVTGWGELYETVRREAMQRLWPPDYLEAQRAMAAHHQQVGYPWLGCLTQPFKLLAMNLPWSALALVTLWPGFARLWDARGRLLLQSLHCWVWPNLLFWSVIPEHASRHSIPLFPGIAGLAAMVWIAWLTGRFSIASFPNSVWERSPGKLCFATDTDGKQSFPTGVPKQSLGTRMRSKIENYKSKILIGIVICWLIVKLVFVHVVIPQRNPARAPRAKGEQLASLVPEGKTLYLFQLKDEGIMFYYSELRNPDPSVPPVRRLKSPAELPSSGEPVYCILDEPEWRRWQQARPAEALLHLEDEQKAPIVLVRVQ
jgi:4-amino-4-deoxy-L-arabinose transferase-like glycosyltransferase